jgi:hypothetical protein
MKLKNILAVVVAFWLVIVSGQAQAITLPDPTTIINGVPVALPFGDFYSYSLPILAFYYDEINGGGVGPGNPYYVTSPPGAIKDDIVIATGASGNPVNQNFAGMDNAYPTPSGADGSPLFSTGNTPDPGQVGGPFTGDAADTWDMQINALLGYLTVGSVRNDLLFFFNNNQENSGAAANQNLYAWGQARIVDAEGGLPALFFDLTDNQSGPVAYTSPGAANGNYPYPGGGAWPGSADFILSGGQIVVPHLNPADGTEAINHNLGANQAVYAIFSPEINLGLEGWLALGYDAVQLDIRFYDLNNGYEQVFIQRGMVGYPPPPPPPPVPEPATMLLLGSGLLGLAGYGRKKFFKKD